MPSSSASPSQEHRSPLPWKRDREIRPLIRVDLEIDGQNVLRSVFLGDYLHERLGNVEESITGRRESNVRLVASFGRPDMCQTLSGGLLQGRRCANAVFKRVKGILDIWNTTM